MEDGQDGKDLCSILLVSCALLMFSLQAAINLRLFSCFHVCALQTAGKEVVTKTQEHSGMLCWEVNEC